MKLPRVPATPALLVSSLWVIGAALPLVGQTPKTLEQIPVYPGATLQPAREAEEAPSLGPETKELGSIAVRVYRVNAGIEDVIRFYQQRLQARKITSDAEHDLAAAAEEALPVGQTTRVMLEVEAMDLSPSALEEAAAGSERSAEQLASAMRAAYARARQPFRPGSWLVPADLSWASRLTAAQGQEFHIGLEDIEAWELLEPSYHNQTEIVIRLEALGEAVAAEEPEERAPATPLKAPSETELGVLLYPGAQFDGRVSGEMSASDEEANYYIYTSTDAPQQLTRFCESRTGKKGLVSEGGVLIVLVGEGLFPDLGVTIQPNVGTYPPSVKTMLTIRKRR